MIEIDELIKSVVISFSPPLTPTNRFVYQKSNERGKREPLRLKNHPQNMLRGEERESQQHH